MKTIIRTNSIEVTLVKAVVVGVAKTDDDSYALFLGCIVIELKPYNMFRRSPRPIKF